ncbi:peptide ABC transporter substrate-binding protein [Glycomyces xiaoerkulensis]|uniref:peptide ABC transporter substrate-binding protein n=1 Tax=Glycomyces xiaoerkulensis TaxID=2038139 RepID=UPI00130014E1|nr:ABC transporter substrate-binding protein [Glycomyces xiaoerkulensis]
MRRTRYAVATGAAAALALTACAGDESDVDSGDGDGGGTVNMQIGEVRSLIPGGSGESEGFRIMKNVYDGLVYYDAETGEPDNLVAEEITSEDNQTWTIRIQEGLEFHNGEPVDAEAFVRGWNRVAYGPNALPLNYFMASIEGYDEMNPDPLPEEEWSDPDTPEFPDVDTTELSGLTVVDDLTLEVELSAPFIGFPTMLGYEAFFPVAQECLDDTDACEEQPIGNGPFMFEEPYNIQSGGTAVAWDDYQGDKPANIDAVDWTVYLEGSDCWSDFMTGSIDVCRPTAADYEQAQNDPELAERHIQQDGTSILMLAYTLYDPKFEDVNLRRALSAAIDREGVITVIGEDRANPLDTWVPESILGGGQGACGEYCEYNPDLANDLLDEAGGWPEDEPLRIWVNDAADNLDVFRAVGDSISQTLDIEYEIVPMEWTDFLAEREAQSLDGPFRSGWGPDYNLNENYLDPIYGGGARVNHQGYESEEYQAKMDEAAAADTLDEAVGLYQEAEQILAEDMPSAPIWVDQVNYYYSERVDNVIVHPIYSGPGGDAELRDIEVVE